MASIGGICSVVRLNFCELKLIMSKYSESPDAHSSNGVNKNSPTDKPRKKKRTLGSFPCPDCDKVFTRSDHLARHHLNHEPKELFECEAIIEDYGGNKRKCGKTFVRKDLKERHAKRHLELANKNYPKSVRSSFSNPSKSSVSPQASPGESPIILPNYQTQSPLQISNLIHGVNHAEHTHNGTGSHLPPVNSSLNNTIGNQVPINPIKDARFPQQEPRNFNGRPPYIHPQNNAMASHIQDMYADQYKVPNFGNNIPQSQNDILSWLFTESPENMIVTPGSENMKRESLKGVNQIDPSPNNIHSQVHLNSGPVFDNTVKGHIPFPYSGSQFSPIGDHIQQQHIQQQQINNQHIQHQVPQPHVPQQQVPQQDNQYKEEVLAPFYHNDYQNPQANIQSMNNYGMQDVNIFSNDDNPLDEVFLRNYQAQSVNGSEPLLSGLNYKFNMSSTGSSNSPTTTNESTSPVLTSDLQNSPISGDQNRKSTVASLQKFLMPDKNNIEKNKHIFINSLLVDKLIKSLPTVSRKMIDEIFEQSDTGNEDYSIENRFSYYLSTYWSIFHPQFTILHRPSFDTKTAEPLLLLPMIIVGCNYCTSSDKSNDKQRRRKKSPEFKFCLSIATPLRFMIFQHEDFKSPVKVWILQSLNILEWCEKNFLLRRLHERGHIHHGTTVQLLRRSPLLGGNPATTTKKTNLTSGSNTSADESDTPNDMSVDNNDTTDYDLFVKWVESESMKRITFMTFYLDIIDYIKFRHNPQIMFYQLQLLNLPCDDDHLWESTEVNGSFRKIVKRQKKLQKPNQDRQNGDLLKKRKDLNNNYPLKIRNGESFLNVLKKLLKPYKTPSSQENKAELKLSLFTRKVLFAGLFSIMYQMQQTDLQNSSSLLTNINGNNKSQGFVLWKEVLSKAFDNWHLEINGNCCSEVFKTPSNTLDCIIKSQCQFPMYHLTQIIGMADINHYDIAIFGGSPANMSVSATMKDHAIVQNKLNSIWLKNPQTKRSTIDLVNLKSIIHCYLLLWELMLKPLNVNEKTSNVEFIDWNVDDDYFDGMYAVGIATLVLWSFAFSTCGIESQRFIELDDLKKVSSERYEDLVELSAEGCYEYLQRIRQEFLTNLRKDNLHNEYSIHPFKLNNRLHAPHEIISKYCDLLPFISNKQNISGLCFLVGTKLLSSQWDIIRENGKLILNCGFRSLGKRNILCLDLFDELSD